MSLKKERANQYFNFRLGKKKNVRENDEKNQQNVEHASVSKKRHRKQSSQPWLDKVLRKVKNVVCFSGAWIWLVLYFGGLDVQKYWYVYGAIVAAVTFGNMNLLMTGKKNYDLWDAFNFLELTDSTWRYQEQVRKNPPLVEELLTKIKERDCRFAKEGMSDYYSMADETRGGIVAGVSNAISTFVTDRDILEVLTKSEKITPDLLLKGERIFICIPEHKLDVYRELLQLIISQFLRYFEQLKDHETRPILMMLDEFARLGRYDKLTNGLATLRSKKVTIMILTQSVSQLDMIYGSDTRKVMTDNCSYKVILNASDADSQQYFSNLAGTYVKYQRSYTRGQNSSYSISEHELPIVRPEELATLKKELVITPYGVQWVEKRPYYRERG